MAASTTARTKKPAATTTAADAVTKAAPRKRASRKASDEPKIIVRGAREHNLKKVNVEMPRDKLVVFTGLSGSGKSSLAFDTIYAEGQRRYVESLSAYARQFLGQMDPPDVDMIEGLSPAISIDQKSGSRNPRSTVGTITEVYNALRLLLGRNTGPHRELLLAIFFNPINKVLYLLNSLYIRIDFFNLFLSNETYIKSN